MKFTINGVENSEFEIPDNWWLEADMDTFSRLSNSYRPGEPTYSLEVHIIALKSINPMKRNPGVADLVEERMINILKGIRSNNRIGPIIVIECPDSEKYSHRLKDGYHRLRASIACGFSHIPVIVDIE